MNTDAHTPLHELARQFPDSLEAAVDDMVDSGFGSLDPESTKLPAPAQVRDNLPP